MTDGFTTYTIGQPYVPGKRHWPEVYDYNYRGNIHELRLFLRQPYPQEIEAVRSGPARFTFATFGPEYLIFSWAFQVDVREFSGDCSYSWWLVDEAERTIPTLDFPPGYGAPLTVFLIDAETGILKAMRSVGLGGRFTLKLHRAISGQMKHPLPDDYESKLRSILDRYTTSHLMNKLRKSSYRAGELDD